MVGAENNMSWYCEKKAIYMPAFQRRALSVFDSCYLRHVRMCALPSSAFGCGFNIMNIMSEVVVK